MKLLKTARKKLGLSQEQMALWLGVGDTLYSMAETGRRQLPTAALLKLAQLATTDPGKQAAPALPSKVAAEEQQALQKMLAETQYQILKLERQLKKMKAVYNTCGPLHQLLRQIAPPGKNQADNTREQLWAAVMKAELTEKLAHCGPVRQQMLQAQLEGLAVTAERLEKALET